MLCGPDMTSALQAIPHVKRNTLREMELDGSSQSAAPKTVQPHMGHTNLVGLSSDIRRPSAGWSAVPSLTGDPLPRKVCLALC